MPIRIITRAHQLFRKLSSQFLEVNMAKPISQLILFFFILIDFDSLLLSNSLYAIIIKNDETACVNHFSFGEMLKKRKKMIERLLLSNCWFFN